MEILAVGGCAGTRYLTHCWRERSGGAAALENSLAISKKCKHRTNHVSQPLHSYVFLQEK